MTPTQKTLIALSIILAASACLLYFYSRPHNAPLLVVATTSQPQATTSASQSLTVPEASTSEQYLGEAKFLFTEGEYSYVQYVRETEGDMPVYRVSSSTKENIGFSFGWQDRLSPDKHSVQKASYDYKTGQSAICLTRIDSKKTNCVQSKPGESFITEEGDLGEPFVAGEWTSTSTFTYSVFKDTHVPYNATTTYTPINNKELLREETISI